MSLEVFPPIYYRRVFDATAEFPKLDSPISLWVEEATLALNAFDFEKIRQVVRYRLFPDNAYPRTCLLQRSTAFLDQFLATLPEFGGQAKLENLSHVQKVEEILLRSGITRFQRILWDWSPTPGHSQDAKAIADAIETESHNQFGRIAFEEIVRASLGYKTEAVEWFLHQHTLLYIYLVKHLCNYPEEISLYKDVEKVLRTKSPFAHRALLQSLFDVRPEMAHEIPRPPAAPAFEFIARPIQRLFNLRTTLTQVLNILEVLAVRFRRQYIHTRTMKWNLAFDTEIPFLEDYYISTSAKDLAFILTLRVLKLHEDAKIEEISSMPQRNDKAFTGISLSSIANGDWRGIMADWHALRHSVWECCVVLPNIVADLENCTQILLEDRNYHSFTALIDGLYRYNISMATWGLGSNVNVCEIPVPEILSNMIHLIDPAQNHLRYLQYYDQYPGIPWIEPHLRKHQQDDQAYIKTLVQ